MNPNITKQFETLVSQATGSIIASPKRRQAIADELLAHLTQTYEEELSRTNDESAALQNTLQRFGNLEQLQQELRSSIPLHQRIITLITQPETTMSKHSKPLGFALFFVGFAFMFGLAVVMPATAKLAHQANPTLTMDQAIEANDVLRISLHSLVLFAIAVTLTGLALLLHAFLTRNKPTST
jgi:hypothetical protein